ncbi:hypothetical protein D3C76_1556040 [compost metagenome]
MRFGARTEPFEGDDLPVDGPGQREYARACRHAIDDHRARPALAQAAAVFGAVELQVIAQDQQ